MRKNRLLLCFLLGIAILFYGVPYLNFTGEPRQLIFSIAWLLFALMAISGNLIALLYGKYGKHGKQKSATRHKINTHRQQKVRQYS